MQGWRLEAQDNEGHRVKTNVTITSGAAVGSGLGSNRWLLRISLMVNNIALCGFVEIWRYQRRRLATTEAAGSSAA